MGIKVKEDNGRLNKITRTVFMLLLGYISLLPFYYFPPIYILRIKIPIVKYFPLFLILFLLAISFAKGQIKIKNIKQEKLNIYILFYFCSTLLSGIGTAYYPISILKAIYYGLTGILIYFIITSWRLDLVNKQQLLYGITIIGFIVSLYGITTLILGQDVLFEKLQYANNHAINPKIFLEMGRMSSSLGNPHILGTFLSAIFPISLYLFLLNLEQTKKLASCFIVIMSIVIFFAATLTFSVGVCLSVFLFYILYHVKINALYNILPFKKIMKLLFSFGIVLLCVILGMMGINILLNLYNKDYIFDKFFGRIDFHKLANAHGFTYRFDTIKYTFNSLKTGSLNELFFGRGIGEIGRGDNRFLRNSYWMDNFYCLSLVESGLASFFIMLVMFYLIIKKGCDKFKNTVSLEEKKLDIFLLVGLSAFFINMLFSDAFTHPTMRILFWPFVGFLVK